MDFQGGSMQKNGKFQGVTVIWLEIQGSQLQKKSIFSAGGRYNLFLEKPSLQFIVENIMLIDFS